MTELRRAATGVLTQAPTKDLAEDLEAHLRLRAGGLSLEVLRQLRDHLWFPDPSLRTSLHALLITTARRHLRFLGGRAALRTEDDAPTQASRWRWLSLVLPPDLLVAALAADQHCEPTSDHVLIVSPLLRQELREPCAETHLHVGAALSFCWLWTCLMSDIDQRDLPRGKLPDPLSRDGASFPDQLQAAATTRLLLCAFLQSGAGSFRAFLGNEPQAGLSRILARVPGAFWEHRGRPTARQTLGAMLGQAPAPPLALARRLYRALAGTLPPLPADPTLAQVLARDPLALGQGLSAGYALPETRFTAQALRRLGAPAPDHDFARFFWQYQRVRCHLYRHLTEEPGTAGLDWFTRHFYRISPLRGSLDTVKYACALETQGRDLHLGALEARTAPAATWPKVRDEVRALAAQAGRQPTRPEVGLILHFIKERERSNPARLHGDPTHPAFLCRHGLWFRDRLREAHAVATALDHHPELLLVLRGLDVANVELAQPTWLLPPLFHPVQEAAERAAAHLQRLRPAWRIEPLRTTLHAGEDFRCLPEGLRRVHEPIEFGLLRRGDRLGHAIALGEDPERFAAAHRSVLQPVEERLDDLLWELERYQQRQLRASHGRQEWLHAEILRLGHELYPAEAITTDDLLASRRLRFDGSALQRLQFPYIRWCPARSTAERLLWRYLTDPGVFSRGQRPLEVKSDPSEIAMLHAAQRWLRGVVGALEIHIESNPSSNLLIGDYPAVAQHPAFRLQPLPGTRRGAGDPVPLSVNTDNPITFSSNLADEFAYLYYALLERGVPSADAYRWLARARESGWRSRFTLPASQDAAALRELRGVSPQSAAG